MALSQDEFNSAFGAALDQWQKAQLSAADGHFFKSSDDMLAYSLRDDPKMRDKVLGKVWAQYQKDPTSYMTNVSRGEFGDWQKSLVPLLPADKFQGGGGAATTAAVDTASKASAADYMKAFGASLMQPLNQNDPYVQRLTALAQTAGQSDARMRGIQGGLAVENTQQGVTNALSQAQTQRQQLGLQAMQGGAGLDLQQAQLAQQQYAQAYQANMQNQMNQYNSSANTARGVGGIIGGAIGGVAGAYFGGPAGAQAGLSVGSGIGSGIGGMAAGAPPSMTYNPPATPRGLGTGY